MKAGLELDEEFYGPFLAEARTAFEAADRRVLERAFAEGQPEPLLRTAGRDGALCRKAQQAALGKLPRAERVEEALARLAEAKELLKACSGLEPKEALRPFRARVSELLPAVQGGLVAEFRRRLEQAIDGKPLGPAVTRPGAPALQLELELKDLTLERFFQEAVQAAGSAGSSPVAPVTVALRAPDCRLTVSEGPRSEVRLPYEEEEVISEKYVPGTMVCTPQTTYTPTTCNVRSKDGYCIDRSYGSSSTTQNCVTGKGHYETKTRTVQRVGSRVERSRRVELACVVRVSAPGVEKTLDLSGRASGTELVINKGRDSSHQGSLPSVQEVTGPALRQLAEELAAIRVRALRTGLEQQAQVAPAGSEQALKVQLNLWALNGGTDQPVIDALASVMGVSPKLAEAALHGRSPLPPVSDEFLERFVGFERPKVEADPSFVKTLRFEYRGELARREAEAERSFRALSLSRRGPLFELPEPEPRAIRRFVTIAGVGTATLAEGAPAQGHGGVLVEARFFSKESTFSLTGGAGGQLSVPLTTPPSLLLEGHAHLGFVVQSETVRVAVRGLLGYQGTLADQNDTLDFVRARSAPYLQPELSLASAWLVPFELHGGPVFRFMDDPQAARIGYRLRLNLLLLKGHLVLLGQVEGFGTLLALNFGVGVGF